MVASIASVATTAAADLGLVLRAGANPNATQATGETVLMTCARGSVVAAVTPLLARGADVNATEASRCQILLNEGADPNLGPGFAPLHWAAASSIQS